MKSMQIEAGKVKIPSASALAARMMPSHPSRAASLRYMGTLNICHKIQRRSARKIHPDAHYNNCQGMFARQHVIAAQQAGYKVVFVSDDDKCKVSVGQPGFAQTAVTRARRVIAGADFGRAFANTRAMHAGHLKD